MCNCIELINEKLKEHNTAVVHSINFFDPTAPSRMYVSVVKADSKRRVQPRRLIATFCPICGEKYQTDYAVATIDEPDTVDTSK